MTTFFWQWFRAEVAAICRKAQMCGTYSREELVTPHTDTGPACCSELLPWRRFGNKVWRGKVSDCDFLDNCRQKKNLWCLLAL